MDQLACRFSRLIKVSCINGFWQEDWATSADDRLRPAHKYLFALYNVRHVLRGRCPGFNRRDFLLGRSHGHAQLHRVFKAGRLILFCKGFGGEIQA